eukprot:scaffold7736_cov97-Skeletonema_menzelii.AAC.1
MPEDYGSGAHRPLLCPLRPLFGRATNLPRANMSAGFLVVTPVTTRVPRRYRSSAGLHYLIGSKGQNSIGPPPPPPPSTV